MVAGADRVGRNPRKCLPDAAGRPFQPSRSRLCQSAQYCGHRLFGGGAQARHCHRISLQDHRRAGLISGLGWSSAGAGLGCQRQTPHRTKDADPVRQPLLVSYPGPRMGSSHHQSQRASSLPGPGDLERPRVRRLPSPQGRHCLHQGGKLFY